VLGDYESLWEAQARDERLRVRNGGGIITSLLLYGLEKGLITEALAVRGSPREPWAEPTIARTADEILATAGSKYTFVPYGPLVDGLGRSSAVVGLPCQTRAYRDRDLLKLGLFCGLNLSPRGLEYLLRHLGVDSQDIESLDYRAPGGGLLVKLKSGEEIRYGGYAWLAYFFSYKKCIYCTDYSNHCADVAVGDRRPQWSSVIVRTQRGKELFLGALRDGYIQAKSLSADDLVSGLMSPFFQKEMRGGYISTPWVRVRGRWAESLPLPVTKRLGSLILGHTAGRGK